MSDASQDDSVFTNVSYSASDNAGSEGAVTSNEEEQDAGLGTTDSCDVNSAMKDSSMPPWLAVVSYYYI